MLIVHRSNSLAALAEQLGRVVTEPGLGPLEAEILLIQTAGVQRWLSRELSRRLGVLAGARFPFPRAFLHELLDGALGEAPHAKRYEREALGWLLFRLLGKERPGPVFEPVRAFLAKDADGSQRFFLAERLAYLFDQYVIYRPELVLGWQSGQDEHDFQAVLWREIVAELGPEHFAERARRFIQEVSDERIRELVPPRLSLVGGPGLPPSFLELLARVGRVVDVHLFSFSVCREYFADAHPIDDPLPEVGEGLHPLLISLGRVGADYQKLLERHPYVESPIAFVEPRETSVLGALQRDLLEGRVRPPEERLVEAFRADRSITLDSCHSPLREVEVLHDKLLGLFADDPSLRPEDVVVLVPTIERYAPLVSTVFGARAGEQPLFSYRIADRNERSENPAARAFLLALSVLGGRLKASQVLDLLQAEPVRERFGLDPTDLERIAGFIAGSGVRWGAGAEHKREFELPDDERNTWREGLRRLLLGFAMADDGERLFRGVVPYDDVAASDAQVLGGLAELVETLLDLREKFAGATKLAHVTRTPAEWCALCRELARALLSPSRDGSWAPELVFEAITAVEDGAREAQSEEPLGLSLVVHRIEAELEGKKPSTDFLAGGITFCELLPLRTIPFRVICVLGLNQGDFPRADVFSGFDRMQERRREGDRSIRDDDRYLFLEMLLAARERVCLSYVGRSVQDNADLPPSVVVSELAHVLEGMFAAPAASGEKFLAPVLHPLQPFSPSYFDGSRAELSSSSESWLEGARSLRTPERKNSLFAPEGPLALEVERRVELGEFIRFFRDPAAGFLRGLGVVLRDEIETLEDREPVVVEPLRRFTAGSRLLERRARGLGIEPEIELRRGEFPAGTPGRAGLEELVQLIDELDERARGYRGEESRVEPLRLEFALPAGGALELVGRIEGLHGARRVEVTCGKLNPKRRLASWLHHLAVRAAGLDVEETILIGRAEGSRVIEERFFPPLEPSRAREILHGFVLRYVEGRARPLRFHPEASLKLVSSLRKKSTEDEPLLVRERLQREVDDVLNDRGYGREGRYDPNVRQLFGAEDPYGFSTSPDVPLEELEVVALALEFWGPLLEEEQRR